MTPETEAILTRARSIAARRLEASAQWTEPDAATVNRRYAQQKAALTRAGQDPDAVVKACLAAVTEWDTWRAWPDDWSRWQRALDDALGFGQSVSLEDLAATLR